MTADLLATLGLVNGTVKRPLPAVGALLQSPYTLALNKVPEVQTRLRVGGAYWLTVDGTEDADHLTLQLLRAM
jgi:hypothetical protein